MLRRAKEQGKINSDTKIVEYSSGSTVTSLAILGRIMGLKGAIAYVSNKTSQAKLDLLRFFVRRVIYLRRCLESIDGFSGSRNVSKTLRSPIRGLTSRFRKLFGGPGQPSPTDENGGIYRATVDGKFGDNFNPSQYLNPDVRLFVRLSLNSRHTCFVRIILPTNDGRARRLSNSFRISQSLLVGWAQQVDFFTRNPRLRH